MRVMGIDAGLQGMGVVIAEGDRIIHCATNRTQRTAKKRGIRVADDDAERCASHARFLQGVIREWRPGGVLVELPTGGAQGARANRAMGMATGVVVAVIECMNLPAEWITPAEVKLAAAGQRDASKEAVAEAVLARFIWEAQLPKAKAEAEHILDAAGLLLAAQTGTLMRTLAMTEKKGA